LRGEVVGTKKEGEYQAATGQPRRLAALPVFSVAKEYQEFFDFEPLKR